MAWGFRKSRRLAPGIRLNFGKRGVGVSVGGKGARTSVSSTGRRTNSFSWLGFFWRKSG
jgi:Protein of unknown function (DUF4236)